MGDKMNIFGKINYVLGVAIVVTRVGNENTYPSHGFGVGRLKEHNGYL